MSLEVLPRLLDGFPVWTRGIATAFVGFAVLATGWGQWSRKTWAWTATIFLSVATLVLAAIGVSRGLLDAIVAVSILVVYLLEGTRRWFGTPPDAASRTSS